MTFAVRYADAELTANNRGPLAAPGGVPPGLVEDVAARNLTTTIGERGAGEAATAAKIALIEFTDFECPFCGSYARETLPRLKAEFVESKRMAYTFMNFPIDGLHPQARTAAGAAVCAQKENKFWEMHEWLFANQGRLSLDGVRAQARALSVDERCFESVHSDVARDIAEGRRLGVDSTPTFFLGEVGKDGVVSLRRKIKGAVPYDVFKTEILKLLGARN